MGTENLGRIVVVHQGPYNASSDYVPLDEVSYNGSTYRCKANSTGTLPIDTNKWVLVSAKGEPGEDGTPGADGADGVGAFSGTFSINASGELVLTTPE